MNNALSKELVEITSATLPLIGELVSFFNDYHARRIGSEHWIWQYATSRKDKAVFAILRDRTQIVATQGMMPFHLNMGPRNELVAKSENTLLLPAYRGGSEMADLYEYAVDRCSSNGMHLIWGFSHAVKAFERFGFAVLPGMDLFVRPGAGVLAPLVQYFKRHKLTFRNVGSMAKLMASSLGSRSVSVERCRLSRYEISEQPLEQADLQDLYERIRSEYPGLITLNFSDSFLNWRVRNHPSLKYREYQIRRLDRLLAYAVVVMSDGRLWICDLTSEATEPMNYLINFILSKYLAKVAQFCMFLNSHSPPGKMAAEVLTGVGFRWQGSSPFVLRSLCGDLDDSLHDMARWHLNGLWSDGLDQ